MLTIPAIFVTRPHACASLQTCVIWHAVTQLFAGWCHSGPLKAQQGLGVGVDVVIGNETLKKTP